MHKKHVWRSRLFGSRKRKIISVSAIALCLMGATAGAAVAWFEGQGSTTSTETTGAAVAQAVTVSAGNLMDALTPGSVASAIPVTVTNSSANTVAISNVVVSVTGTSNANCTAADFTIVQAATWIDQGTGNPSALPLTLAAGGVIKDTGGGGSPATIQLNANAPGDCVNVTVNLSEVVS